MTQVLDGYLIGRAAGGGGGTSNPFFYRHLGPVALLDGYLTRRSHGAPSERRPIRGMNR